MNLNFRLTCTFPGLGTVHTCDGVNPVNGITILPSFYYMVSMNVFKLEFYWFPHVYFCLFISTMQPRWIWM